MWLIGATETKSRKILCDFMLDRTMENLKTFVNNHILSGTHITTDGFPEYSFLDDQINHYRPMRSTYMEGEILGMENQARLKLSNLCGTFN